MYDKIRKAIEKDDFDALVDLLCEKPKFSDSVKEALK